MIYPEIIHKDKDSVPDLPGFTRLESRSIRFSFTVRDEQIGNLLSMTPHFWRISKEGARHLAELKCLQDEASIVINVYEAQ